MIKTLTRISGINGLEIAFPSHQGEHGTCDFMTATCKKECPSWNAKRDIASLMFFESNSISTICKTLEGELKEKNFNVLSWFIESGDCPERLTYKIAKVVIKLARKGVPQNGFTRNKDFWRHLNNIQGVNICLTVEDQSESERLMREGSVAVPRYDEHRVVIDGLFICGGGLITCGCGSVEQGDEYEEDCSLCQLRKIGCFSNHKKEVA